MNSLSCYHGDIPPHNRRISSRRGAVTVDGDEDKSQCDPVEATVAKIHRRVVLDSISGSLCGVEMN